MKIHRYEIRMFDAPDTFNQQRAYIPGICVLGYSRDGEDGDISVDFFSRDSESLETARQLIASKRIDVNYLGEYELPQLALEQLVNEASAAKKGMDKTQSAYDESLRKLVCLVEYIPKVGRLTK
jgi:hypothetical protein